MKIVLLGLLLLWISGSSFSQERRAVSGIVMDAVTGESLPYAQIAIKGTTLGSVTNEEGFFRLTLADAVTRDAGLPDAGSPDTLLVSFLGYRTGRISVAGAPLSGLNVFLVPISIDLREVEIIALTPLEVLRRAFDSIPVNYGSDSLILTAFIRTQKTVNKKLAEYTEAIVEDLKTGYSTCSPRESGMRHQASNIPKLHKGRVTSDTNLVNLLGEVGANASCLGCNFVRDIAEFPYETVLDQRDQKHYTFAMNELDNPEGGKIYRVLFDQNEKTGKRLYQGEILISARDFAVMRITFKPSFKAYDAYEKQKYNRLWYLNNQPGWVQEMPLGETTVTYSKRGGYWTLSTIRQQYWVTYVQPRTGQRIGYGYKNEVVVTDVSRDPLLIREFDGDKSLGVNQRWDEVVGESDEQFWENFNYLPIEEKLQEELLRLK